MLVLNATTLNTGHNWQFTASWMGEPPISGEGGVDTNYRLRRMYYSEAPENYRQIRLGYAVAASSCVPSLFDPLNLPNLYPDNVVRLVDGGVQDNQGATALLDQGCNVLLVSDASGQMGEQQDPSKNFIGVPLRSNTILQARIRLSEFENLASRRRASVDGLGLLHKKDLEKDSVDWVNCEDPVAASDDARPAWQKGELTSYESGKRFKPNWRRFEPISMPSTTRKLRP
jgi:predicted acylesterase/phospholipase RssA